MQDERLFELAVQLATAFVANGDIRLHDNTNRNNQAMHMLVDLIPTTCQVLAESWQHCQEVVEQTPGILRSRPDAEAHIASASGDPGAARAATPQWLDRALAGKGFLEPQLPPSELQKWLGDLTGRLAAHDLVLRLSFAQLVDVDRARAERFAEALQGLATEAIPAGVASRLEELAAGLQHVLSEAPDE